MDVASGNAWKDCDVISLGAPLMLNRKPARAFDENVVLFAISQLPIAHRTQTETGRNLSRLSHSLTSRNRNNDTDSLWMQAANAAYPPVRTDQRIPAPRAEPITPETFEGALDTTGIPDPDLIIRTSGEMRLSNFLLWQAAYAEFVFTDTLWPDFNGQCLDEAIAMFAGRDRRFGGRLVERAAAAG